MTPPQEQDQSERWILWIQGGVLIGMTLAAGITTLILS